LENAEQYLKDAEILIAFRSYGHAYGLVVLGEEEFGKQ
jgi:AbiV family abortive infection protein